MVANRPSHYARHRPIALSPRQRQVLDLMKAGRTNAEIGEELGISLDGAKYHVSEVLAKLGVHSREAAVLRWHEYNAVGSRLSRVAYGLAPVFSVKWLAPAAAIACVGVAGLVYLAAIRGAGSEAAAQPTPPASVSPSAAAQPATAKETKETLTVGEVPRQAVVYVPAKLSAPKVPAIIYLTATGMGPQPLRQRYGIGFDVEADRLGFVAVWAEGSPAPAQGAINISNNVTCCYWDNGSTTWDPLPAPNDIAFFNSLFDLIIAKYPVDPDRISFAGNAGGGVMTYRLACELGDRVAGFADVSSSHRDNASCPNARPVSMMLILGTANPVVSFAGGVNSNRPEGPPIPAVTDVVDYWRRIDACIGDPVVSMLTARSEQRRYSTCRASEVALITVAEGGNGWWGAPFFGPLGDPDLKATPIVAEFLIKQSRAGR